MVWYSYTPASIHSESIGKQGSLSVCTVPKPYVIHLTIVTTRFCQACQHVYAICPYMVYGVAVYGVRVLCMCVHTQGLLVSLCVTGCFHGIVGTLEVCWRCVWSCD